MISHLLQFPLWRVIGGTPPDNLFVPLIEFECTGSSTRFSVTTTKNLGVRWDGEVSKEYTAYDLPDYTTSEHTFMINKTFDETKTRKIVTARCWTTERQSRITAMR